MGVIGGIMAMHVTGGLIMGFAVIMAVTMLGNLLSSLHGLPGNLVGRGHRHGRQNETDGYDRGSQLPPSPRKGGVVRQQNPENPGEQQRQVSRCHGQLPDRLLPSAGSR